MSLETRIVELAQAIGADMKAVVESMAATTSGSVSVDGGSANSVYTQDQVVDFGDVNG